MLIRCNEFLLDFKYGTFSHHFLHDSSEFSHVLKMERQKIRSSSFELTQDPAFKFNTNENPLDFDSAEATFATNDLLYVLSVSLTLLLVGLAAGVYCYCKRPAKNKHVSDTNLDQKLSNLLKSAHDTSIQIDSIVNSARHSRVVEGCAAGLTSTS